MYPGGNPFEPESGDPFDAPPMSGYPASNTGGFGFGAPTGAQYPPKADYNTFAVLSPVFAVIVPPAGVVLGHLALPQIRRTGERGRYAAIAGLIIGYLMCVALIAVAIWRASSDSGSTPTPSATTTTTPAMVPATTRPRPSTVTSVAPAPGVPRIKVDLATVPLGTCVEIQRRSTDAADALDLFKVDCERREGVYTVTTRVAASADCRTVYVAAPDDHSFAVCLDPY